MSFVGKSYAKLGQKGRQRRKFIAVIVLPVNEVILVMKKEDDKPQKSACIFMWAGSFTVKSLQRFNAQSSFQPHLFIELFFNVG